MANISSHLQDELMSGEKIIYTAKPHWTVFLAPIGWLIMSIAIYVIGSTHELDWLAIGNAPPFYKIASGICLLLTLVQGGFTWLNYRMTDYAITNRRVLMKTGILHRYTVGILLKKIEVMKVLQPLFGRIFGYGIVMIIGVGGTHDPFPNLPKPLVFRKKVQTQIEQLENES